MNREEAVHALRGGATVALDSNAVYGRMLLGLADAVNRLNLLRPSRLIRLVIPMIVHAEHLAQERLKFGATFDLQRQMAALRSKGFGDPAMPHCLVPFEETDARGYAALLGRQFATKDGWRDAKRQNCARMLGVQTLPPSQKRCSATTDWLIAAQADVRGWIVVTGDRGGEFDLVARKVSPDTFREALSDLNDEVNTSP